jgi:uncharacterized coiled-coil protein SlyX
MPRGVRGSGKNKNIDERIADIEAEISAQKKTVAALNAKKRKLLKEKNDESKNALMKIVANSGMTEDDLRNLIDKIKN